MKTAITIGASFAAASLYLAVALSAGFRSPLNLIVMGVIIVAAAVAGAIQDRNSRIVGLEAMAGTGLALGLMTLLFPAP